MSDIYPEDGSQASGMRPEADMQSGSPTLKDRASAARDRVGQVKNTVRDEAAHFASTAKERAIGQVEQRQQAVTGAISEFADAIRTAGDQLTERNQTMAAQVVRHAADSLEGVTRSLEGKRPADLLYAVRDFGRRNPVAFIGGTVLVGLAVGRFMRSSMPDNDFDQGRSFAADTGAEWGDDTLMRGDVGTAGAGLGAGALDANSQAFDANAADLTMSPEGAGATVTDSGDLDIGSADDEFGTTGGTTSTPGSTTRGF